MKLNLTEAAQRLNILAIIPVAKIKQSTRIKIIRTQVELEKVNTQLQTDIREGLKKIKPDDFDERLRKYAAGIEPTESNMEEAKKQQAMDGFDEFKSEYDKVNAAYQELYSKAASENRYSVNLPLFNDIDIEDIANTLPAGELTELEPNGESSDKAIKVSNDDILRTLIRLLA